MNSIVDESTAESSARQAENNPEVRGMLELWVRLPAWLRSYVNARYTGRQYCLNADTGNEMALAAKTESNVGIERTFRRVRMLLALDNAANAAIYDQCGLPQPGRTLRVMLTMF